MSELFGNALLGNRSVTLVTASPLHYQMALALFVVSQAVAKNQPVAPVTGRFAQDHGRHWLLCGLMSVGRFTMHCRVRYQSSEVITSWCSQFRSKLA